MASFGASRFAVCFRNPEFVIRNSHGPRTPHPPGCPWRLVRQCCSHSMATGRQAASGTRRRDTTLTCSNRWPRPPFEGWCKCGFQNELQIKRPRGYMVSLALILCSPRDDLSFSKMGQRVSSAYLILGRLAWACTHARGAPDFISMQTRTSVLAGVPRPPRSDGGSRLSWWAMPPLHDCPRNAARLDGWRPGAYRQSAGVLLGVFARGWAGTAGGPPRIGRAGPVS